MSSIFIFHVNLVKVLLYIYNVETFQGLKRYTVDNLEGFGTMPLADTSLHERRMMDMCKGKLVRINVLVCPDVWKQIRLRGIEEGKSGSSILRDLIQRGLEVPKHDQPTDGAPSSLAG